MDDLGKQIVEHFKAKGFNRHLNPGQTEDSDHWYIDKHLPRHIDIQGSSDPYIGMRLIGIKHVEYEYNFDTSDMLPEEIIKEIEGQVEDWEAL